MKYITLTKLVLLFSLSNAGFAQIKNVDFDKVSDKEFLKAKCDKEKFQDISSDGGGVFVGRFTNNTDKDIFLWKYKVLKDDKNNFALFNPTVSGSHNAAVIFNKPLLESISWKVKPNQTIRHLTTYEEYGSPKFGVWSLKPPYKDVDGTLFNNANIRLNGKYPIKPISKPNYDFEVRISTMFDFDNNKDTFGDNVVDISCLKYIIK